jgi:hypothetical protein
MPLPVLEDFGEIKTSPKASARRAGNEQCLGDMPWISRATAIKPDAAYVLQIHERVKFLLLTLNPLLVE